jgi:hypothetical protein
MISKKKLAKINKLRRQRKRFEDYIVFTKQRIYKINKKLFDLIIRKN